MDTDYETPQEVDRIRARVSKVLDSAAGEEERETWVREFAVAGDTSNAPGSYTLPATFGILPGDGDLDRDIVIELEALGSSSDEVLVSRRVKTRFMPDETRLLRMHLYRACASLSCETGESCGCADMSSCSAPSCIDETVRPEDLEPIDDPGALPGDAGIPTFDASVPDAGVPDSSVPPEDGGTEPDASIPDGGTPDGGGINCEPPLSVCGLDCVNTEADPRYCGDCDTACADGQVCELSRCIDPGDCRTNDVGCSGFSYCDEESGECLPGCVDSAQCNGENQVCDVALHDCVCDDGFESCPAGCVDTESDPSFCGTCSTVCPIGNVCEQGICIDPGDCRTNSVGCTGFTYCDTASGDCLRGCDDSSQCTGENEVCDIVSHECVCAEGSHLCGAVCLSDLDPNSCGTSCTPCPAPPNSTATCTQGLCDFSCAENYERCDQACCPTSCPPGQVLYDRSCAPVHVQIASDQGNLGEFSSIALDAADMAHIACYASSGRNLRYLAQQADATWVSETPDGPNDVGRYSSIAIDPSGAIHVAYYDQSDTAMMFATRQGDDNWVIDQVDQEDVGEHSSLAFDAAGTAHLSYYDKDERDLKYARQTSGGGWAIERVDSDDDVGQHTSLAVGSDGAVHVSYYDSSNRDLKYALRQPGGGWVIQTVASSGDLGKDTSLALDAAGVPHISFYGESGRDFLYATQLAPASWAVTTIESDGDVGKEGSLAFGPDGVARVSYYDESARDLKFAIRLPDDSWAIQTIDSDGDVGRHTSIAVDTFGNAHISYEDRTSDIVKYALIAAPE